MFTLELDSFVYPGSWKFVFRPLNDFICRFNRHGVFTQKQFFVGVAVGLSVEILKEMFKRRENATSFQTTDNA